MSHKYLPTIGLEIHVELKTRTKMFCDCKNDPDEKHPNLNICPICLAHPGTLPVINREAVRKIILAGLAFSCEISRDTFFERKNYFYPDLPKGYQISQFQKPFCREGYLDIEHGDKRQPGVSAELNRIRIERIHLEEDTGRSQHSPSGDGTHLDFNRAGVPLMELVTHPDLKTPEDVREFAQELQLILRYLGVSDADMEKGQMRVEVNISVAPEGAKEYGTKVEIKNINSINAAGRAAEYEFKRQVEALEAGEKIIQETRGWDENKNRTVSQRTKEGSADYRYFPEPDLPPLKLSDELIEEIKSSMPELPGQRLERFAREYGLPEADIAVFTINKSLGDYFEHVASELDSFDNLKHLKQPEPEHRAKVLKLASNYLITELARRAGEIGADLADTKISPERFADLMVRIFHGEISSSAAQTVLAEMFATGATPEQVIREKDLAQMSGEGILDEIVGEVIGSNQSAVEDFKKGKEAPLKFLIGKVMAASKGKANPKVAESILRKKLTQ